MIICGFCGKSWKNEDSLKRHSIWCKDNPDRYVYKPKSETWYAAMHARKGKGTNHYTKAKRLGLPKPILSPENLEKLRNF
jgi:hypothetical protein